MLTAFMAVGVAACQVGAKLPSPADVSRFPIQAKAQTEHDKVRAERLRLKELMLKEEDEATRDGLTGKVIRLEQREIAWGQLLKCYDPVYPKDQHVRILFGLRVLIGEANWRAGRIALPVEDS